MRMYSNEPYYSKIQFRSGDNTFYSNRHNHIIAMSLSDFLLAKTFLKSVQ